MATVTIDRETPVQTSQWRTGGYWIQHSLEYRTEPGYSRIRALMASLPEPWHVTHMGGDGWALRDLAPNASTRNWTTSGNRRGLDDVEVQFQDFEDDNPNCKFILSPHNYGTWISGLNTTTSSTGRPRNTTDISNLAILVDQILDRYPGRYFAVMYGQELKGGYSRSNPTEFINHYNQFFNELKITNPSIIKVGPHLGFYGYSGGGGYAGRQADMDALLASTDGSQSIDPTNTEWGANSEDNWLRLFIRNCWDNIDYLGLDVSIFDNNDVVGNGRITNQSYYGGTPLKLLEAMQRRAEFLMMDEHDEVKPIYWSEKYINVDLTDCSLYSEDQQALHPVLDLYGAQGKGLQMGCIGTNAWQPEGSGSSPYNFYSWFVDCDSNANGRSAGTAFKHFTYQKEAIDRFQAGKVFVDCESDSQYIHPFCNDDGEYMIFNGSTSDVAVTVIDTVVGNSRVFTVPATSRITGTLPFPSGSTTIIPVQDWTSNRTASGISVAVGAAQGWAAPTPGHLLLCFVEANQNSSTQNISIDTPSGWTLVKAEPGGAGAAGTRNPRVHLFKKIAVGDETTITVAQGNDPTSGTTLNCRMNIQVIELAGNHSTGDEDGTATSNTGNAQVLSSGTVTTTEDGSFVVAGYASENNVTVTNPPGSGYDAATVSNEAVTSSNTLTVAVFDKGQEVAGGTSIAPTISGGSNRQMSIVQAAFKKVEAVIPPADEITGPTLIGTATSDQNATTAVITVGAGGVPADALVCVDIITHSPATIAVSGVVDSKNGAYAVTNNIDQSTSVRGNTAYLKIPIALVNGDTITVTYNPSSSRRCVLAEYYEGTDDAPRTAGGVTNTGTGDNLTAGSATPVEAGDLLRTAFYMRLDNSVADPGLTVSTGTEDNNVAINAASTNRGLTSVHSIAPDTTPINHAGSSTVINTDWAARTLIFPVAPSDPVPTPPVNTVAPAITGGTDDGDVLTCDTGTWDNDPDTYTYQWKRNGANAIGYTASTYNIGVEEAGINISCVVTATNADGSASATSNTVAIPDAPLNTVLPEITGDVAAIDDVLTVSDGTWDGSPTFTYSWIRNEELIIGETGDTYTLTLADSASTIYARVTGTNANGLAFADSVPVVIDSFDVPGGSGGEGVKNYSFFEFW